MDTGVYIELCGVQWTMGCAVDSVVCSGHWGVQWTVLLTVDTVVCSEQCGLQWTHCGVQWKLYCTVHIQTSRISLELHLYIV